MSIPLIRTSERSDFKRCPWMWYWVWREGIRVSREPTWAIFGSAIHRGLEVWYGPKGVKRSTRWDMIDAFKESLGQESRRMYVEGLEVGEGEIVQAEALGIQMLNGYVDFWGVDRHWDVVHTEQAFQIDVPHPTKPGKVLAIYCGTFDMVVWDKEHKEYRVVDHKTRKTFPRNWAIYDLNDQGGSYLWVATEVLQFLGVLKKSEILETITFNCLRKAMPDDRPKDESGKYLNKDGSVSRRQPGPLFHRQDSYRGPQERVRQYERVVNEAIAMERFRRRPDLLYKNPTEECIRCKLYEFCEADEQDPGAAIEFMRQTFIVRDPYRDHREAMGSHGVGILRNGEEL